MSRIFSAIGFAVFVAAAAASPTIAKDKQVKTFVVVNEAVGVPVFPHDITDRPYEVVGEVKAGVRKATIFSKEASQEKIYRELWERGEKLGADAVINAKYGDSHVTLMSWGSTTATGTAIKFVAAPAVPAAPVEPVVAAATPEAAAAVSEPTLAAPEATATAPETDAPATAVEPSAEPK